MPTPRTSTADAVVFLSAAGVSVLLDITDGRLPAVVHWGADLPGLNASAARTLLNASVPVIGSNNVEAPPRPALLPEHHTGWTGRPGLSGSFAGFNWSPRFQTTSVCLDGAPVTGVVRAGSGAVRVFADDDEALLRLQLTLELLPDGMLRTQASLTNLAEGSYSLEDLNLALPVPAEATEILDFAGGHNNERVAQRGELRTGTHLRENRKGRTGADSAFLLHLGVPGYGFASGEVWAVHVGWSGNHRHYAERVTTGEQLLGGGEVLLPGEVRLDRGHAYETPWLYGSYGMGLDEVARRFHRHLRRRIPRVSAERPVTLNTWEAVYFDHNLQRLLDLADLAASVGVERYVLDDGWFGARRDDTAGLGDWRVSPEVWPRGLHPLVERVHERGMQFGLWFEPEMVNPDSDLAREHPEWIMSARAEAPVESRHQQVLNLGILAAYEHVRDQILAVLNEYPIDYVKWDHNRDLIEAGTRQDAGRPGVRAQTLAFYRLLDEIRREHPRLEIESCSSGGARIDLGVLERADRVWVSDNIDPHDRQRMLRFTAQLVPPEYMGSHIASGRSHATGRRHDLSFRAGTAVFGHLGIEWDLTKASDAELAELRAWVEFYKQERHLLLSGDLVRVDSADSDVLVHGVVNDGRTRAIFAVAVLDAHYPDPPARLKLRGLDPGQTYRVKPIIVGTSPSGLFPPAWWGPPSSTGQAIDPESLRTEKVEGVQFPGADFSGAALERVGVVSPLVHPDNVVLYRIDSID